MVLLRVVGLSCVMLAACQPRKADPSASAGVAVPVEVAVAEKRTVPVELRAIGTVEPVASVQVKSKVEGEILKVHFADGAQVTAGDLLFTIDPRVFEAALKRAEANLAITSATAANALEQAERYTTLIKRGAASTEQTQQILAAAQSRKSEVAARQADVDEARLSLDWTRVTAPISGRVGAALLKAGNIAQPNVDTLAIINQMEPIYVAFALPESSLGAMRSGMSGEPVAVTVRDSDRGDLLDTGVVTFLDNAVDRASGMVAFKGTFPNAAQTLWPGQFVDVTVRLGEEKDRVVVPATAVVEGQDGPQVFVVEGDRAVLRKVAVARATDGIAVIESGLDEGESIVSSGQVRVRAGGKVTVKNPPPTTAAKP